MQRIILSILLMFSLSSYGATYSELAKEYIAKQYTTVVKNLEIIHAKAAPYDAKEIRKDIGKLKIYLDVFQYAYSPAADRDLLIEIRDVLDEGYEVVGLFKDLNDTMDADDIDEELLNERRGAAVKWKSDFLNKSNTMDYLVYLQSPLDKEVYSRKKSELPKFFWATVKFPVKEIEDGEKVLSILLNGMMDTSIDRYTNIMTFENLFKHKREEAFHDYRKLVRAHMKLVDVFFPEQISEGASFSKQYKTLDLMIDKFGEINDNLVGYHHADSEKKKKKLKKKIAIGWYSLKAWMLENDIKDILKNFKI